MAGWSLLFAIPQRRSQALKIALAAAAGSVLIFALFITMLMTAAAPGCSGGAGGVSMVGTAEVSAYGLKTIPRKFMPIYIDAAERFRLGANGWSYLASIHKHENGFADSGGSPTSNAGALGPMQFLAGTWAAYGVDGDGDGRKDVQNVYDAIFGAANYLHASGAPRDWRRALFAYNHADWYVQMVADEAERFRSGGTNTEFASNTESGGEGCGCGPGATPDTEPAVGDLPGDAPELAWPTLTKTIISPFGMRWGRLHAGVDIPIPSGTELHAAAAGKVVTASWVSGYGNYTCLQHATSFSTCYAHQTRIRVKVGQRVSQGQVIGLSGCTGHCFGPHLHFETRLGVGLSGTPVDPEPYLTGRPGPSTTTVSSTVDKSILNFGDSLAVGVEAPLRSRLAGWAFKSDARIGATTDAAVEALASQSVALPTVLAISLGTNDSPTATGRFRDNVNRVLEIAGPNRCVLWFTIRRGPQRGVSYAGLNQVLTSAAQTHSSLRVLDGGVGERARDGVHLTAAGYQARARQIAEAAEQCASELGGGAACAEISNATFDGGELGWPTASDKGTVIGWPYVGTHTLGNWQSDNAIDIAVPVGTPIVAVADGRICTSCGFGASTLDPTSRFAGHRLTLTLANNQVFYAHLSRLANGIKPGAKVRRGQMLGYSGSANAVPHLHIGFRYSDPRQLLGLAPVTRA